MSQLPTGSGDSQAMSDGTREVKDESKKVKQAAPSTSRKRKRESSKADGRGEGVPRRETGNETRNDSKNIKPTEPKINFSSFRHKMLEEHKRNYPKQPFNLLDFQKFCVARWNALNNYVPPRGRGKKYKRTSDSYPPKKPWNAFMFFCKDERPKVERAHPEYAFGDVEKELERRWKAVDLATWELYDELERGDKACYNDKMEAGRD